MKKLILILLLFTNICLGQVNITPTYSQNFNTLTSGTWTDNTTLPGWYVKTDATSVITTYAANTGTTTTAGLYAFGVSGTNTLSDRALGYAASNAYFGAASTGKGYIGCRLRNNTGSTISSIIVTWTGEQWRKENSTSQSLNLSYQIGTSITNLTTGTWTTTSSTFISPQISASTAGTLDGNNPVNRSSSISITIPVTITNGDEIMLRWEDLNDSGNDHQLAIDDVSISTTSSCTPPTISSISPTSGQVGTQVTITASSGSLLNATATIGGVNATVLSSSTTQLVILIPSGATSGVINITDSQPCSTNTNTFTIITPTPQCGYLTDLILSQITDASSGSLSYIEIYNGTGSPVNLSNYSIKTVNNGGLYTAAISTSLANFTLNNNSTYIVALGTSATNCSVSGGDGSRANQTSAIGSINFSNGSSDHFGLFNGTTLIDSFGIYGSSTWADGLIGNNGGDFKRKNNVTLPNTTFNINDWVYTDWIDCSSDEYSDLGLYTFTPPTSTTWNGTNWSNGTPTLSKLAIINGNYNTTSNGDIEACSLIINSSFLLEITSNRYVKIQNNLSVFGTLNVLTNGSLVQVSDNGVNTGNITYNRSVSSLNGYDYIYWSSPVSGQSLSTLYSSPTPGFRYEWNPINSNSNGTFGNWVNLTTPNMTIGRGYIMRSSSSFGWTGNLSSTFTGVPNNGNITNTLSGVNSSITDYRWNLVGNPYPSSIKALSFLTLNTTIDGFVKLWTHGTAPVSTTSPYYQSFQYNYTSNDYITHNGTGTSSGPTGFNGYIASGQGFFVNLLQANTPSSSIVFNNSMRYDNTTFNTYDNSQFYRTSNTNEGRIWLDLLNTNNVPTRMLVGYVTDATIDRDRLYDAITNQDFYTLINNEKFIIQGRPEFNENDQVSVGVNIPTAGEYKIAIAEVDGIFTNQNIYLQDLYSNVIYDIKQSPYIFTTNSGTFNDRFILRYTNSTLGNNEFVINNTIIYNKDNKINIDSNKIIKNVKVYDITGKLLYDNNFNSNNINFSLECSKQILLVKIKTDDDEIITKKVSN